MLNFEVFKGCYVLERIIVLQCQLCLELQIQYLIFEVFYFFKICLVNVQMYVIVLDMDMYVILKVIGEMLKKVREFYCLFF